MPTVRVCLGFVLILSAACGAAPTEDPETPRAPPAPASAAAPAPTKPVAAAAPTREPPASPAPASAHDIDDSEGVRRWSSWDGPKDGSAIATRTAWAIAPNTLGVTGDKPSFTSVMLRVAEVVSSSDKETILREEWGKFAVPSALARPAQPTPGLKKGSVARCSFGGNSVVGRIESADAKSVTCTFLFMEKQRKEKLAPEEVLPLDGSMQMGAPVHARFADRPESWYEGFVVAASGADAWISIDTQFGQGDPRAGRSVHKLQAANVRVLDLKPLKTGEACLANDLGGVAPCKVKAVLAGGLGYTVVFESGSSKDFELDRVARKPKAE